jgi:hypothetical protein
MNQHAIEMLQGDLLRAKTAAHTQFQAIQSAAEIVAKAGTGTEPMDVQNLSRYFRQLGLCLVHHQVVVDALHIVNQTDDVDGLSGPEIDRLKTRLKEAIQG